MRALLLLVGLIASAATDATVPPIVPAPSGDPAPIVPAPSGDPGGAPAGGGTPIPLTISMSLVVVILIALILTWGHQSAAEHHHAYQVVASV